MAMYWHKKKDKIQEDWDAVSDQLAGKLLKKILGLATINIEKSDLPECLDKI